MMIRVDRGDVAWPLGHFPSVFGFQETAFASVRREPGSGAPRQGHTARPWVQAENGWAMSGELPKSRLFSSPSVIPGLLAHDPARFLALLPLKKSSIFSSSTPLVSGIRYQTKAIVNRLNAAKIQKATPAS